MSDLQFFRILKGYLNSNSGRVVLTVNSCLSHQDTPLSVLIGCMYGGLKIYGKWKIF